MALFSDYTQAGGYIPISKNVDEQYAQTKFIVDENGMRYVKNARRTITTEVSELRFLTSSAADAAIAAGEKGSQNVTVSYAKQRVDEIAYNVVKTKTTKGAWSGDPITQQSAS